MLLEAHLKLGEKQHQYRKRGVTIIKRWKRRQSVLMNVEYKVPSGLFLFWKGIQEGLDDSSEIFQPLEGDLSKAVLAN